MRRLPLLGFSVALGLALASARCASPETAAIADEPAPYEPPPVALEPAVADTATFAMGCFWCAETAFEGRPGVASVVSGFTGGRRRNPTYDQVSRGGTGHYEVVQVIYDARRTDYAALLRLFWHNVDPLDGGGQFCDRGDQYRSAIFAHGPAQRRQAEASKRALAGRFRQPVVTPVLPAAPFYAAEAYHQDFWRTNPERYESYRRGCRRDARLDAVWGRLARSPGPAL